MAGSSKKAIYAALGGNGLIAVTKFIAAGMTGSAAMLSEGIHSVVDTGNQVLLLVGLKRAARPPSKDFPFGHGKEVYFWSFIVAILIFALGAGISLYKGVQHVTHPEPLTNIGVNYIVLALAVVFEGFAFGIAMREFNRQRRGEGILDAVRRGKDPSLFVVLFEDGAALLGLFAAMAGIGLAQITGNPIYDGIASIVIGLILAATAVWLAVETQSLLIGESASRSVVAKIRQILRDDSHILTINEVATLHMGPSFILVTISVDFEPALTADDVEEQVTRTTRHIKAVDPRIRRVFIEAQRQPDHRREMRGD